MPRGTVADEPIVSMANSDAFRDGYERTFGDRKPQRGRWVWDAAQGKLVNASEYVAPSRAVDAPILSGRFYENVCATDGADIGSRSKRNEYMRARGLADASDYSPGWYENRRGEQKRDANRQRRETLERAAYTLHKP